MCPYPDIPTSMKALSWRSSVAVTVFVALASTLYFVTRPDNREICARWSAGNYPYDRPDPTLPIERDRFPRFLNVVCIYNLYLFIGLLLEYCFPLREQS
ncbi:hypothetical protein OMCYN_01591 [cyanobiont of Ornithocercus magnificus]|nr:hypothetical protein OMCYN_01591 [cyanobiont of Ornithocercus magnificus]